MLRLAEMLDPWMCVLRFDRVGAEIQNRAVHNRAFTT